MTFTFQNVWENRYAFIDACREKEAYESELKPLIEAKTENEFMQVVYDNFYWICSEIADFEPKFDRAFYFKDGYAKVVLNGKWGFVKEDGSYLVKPKFDYAFDFKNGFAEVELKGKWGFVKEDGSYLVKPKFDYAFDFKNGFARVKLNGKWGFVKEDGSYLIEPKFDYIHRCYEDCAVVELDGKFGYIKTGGTYLAPPIYDFLFNDEECVVRAYLRGIKYTINKANGQILEYSTE